MQTAIAERSLLPAEEITKGLDKIEAPLIKAQTQIIETAAEQLLKTALPMVEAQNLEGITGLGWGAGVSLQLPVYDLWQKGYALGGEHMKAAVRLAIPSSDRAAFSGLPYSGVPENNRRYSLDLDVARLLGSFLDLDPGQLVASAAQAAVLNRAIQLAGSFSQSQITDLKGHLIAAIVPQAGTGDPISRKELLKRIDNTLSAGAVRAENIARTELTNAYNRGRVAMGLRSTLVEAFRFLAIADSRTTEICRTRDGMIIESTDSALLSANTPALHYRCRSTLSPVLPRVNSAHRQWYEDSDRRPQNRTLSDLLPGWN